MLNSPPPGYSPPTIGSNQQNQILTQPNAALSVPGGDWTPTSALPAKGYQSPEMQAMLQLLQQGA